LEVRCQRTEAVIKEGEKMRGWEGGQKEAGGGPREDGRWTREEGGWKKRGRSEVGIRKSEASGAAYMKLHKIKKANRRISNIEPQNVEGWNRFAQSFLK
jgi:hypothetical protein